MRARIAFSLAASLAALACGDSTGSAPLPPLDAGTYDATFRGGLAGAAQGTALVFDLPRASTGPQIWVELRDERVPERNTLVRFVIRGAPLAPGSYKLGGAAGTPLPLEAVVIEYHAGSSHADVLFVDFTGTIDVEEAADGGLAGRFDVRSAAGAAGSLHATGRFNAVPSIF